MSREIVIPQQTVTEKIVKLEEMAEQNNAVYVYTGFFNEDGKQISGGKVYLISGVLYEELNGPATEANPDSPEGTYRNEDLWYYMDLILQRRDEYRASSSDPEKLDYMDMINGVGTAHPYIWITDEEMEKPH